MAFKNRIDDQAFTCGNSRYETDTLRGHPHGAGEACGSVFEHPLIVHDGSSLWLEHVRSKKGEPDCYWLMWYDSDRSPTIPMSSVFDAPDIQTLAARLAAFIQVP